MAGQVVLDAKIGEAGLGRKDWPVGSSKGGLGRKDRPVRSPEGGFGHKDWPVKSPKGGLGRKDRPVRSPAGGLGRKCRPAKSPVRPPMLGMWPAAAGQVHEAPEAPKVPRPDQKYMNRLVWTRHKTVAEFSESRRM